jgi:MerR family transcriptional regulator, thiopeptide resistance regulator
MAFTVKQLAQMAGVSSRTLHYYDEIGLLRPSSIGDNGYRYYEEEALLRLQQILFYRELDFSLSEIAAILDHPGFDLIKSLQQHREAIQQQMTRLSHLIQTIDKTILHLKGEQEMPTAELFSGFDEETQAQYEEEVSQRYGDTLVKESRQRWNGYTAQQKDRILAEGREIYQALLAYIDQEPTSEAVQQLIARWHQHIRYFYEPSPAILKGLGQAYSEDPAFIAVYEKMHPHMPIFLRQAIEPYCRNLPGGE